MLEELIHYMADLPAINTSPLAVALSRSELLTNQGGPAQVNIYRQRMQDPDAPYVLLYDDGERMPGDQGLGGNQLAPMSEIHVLKIECCAQGFDYFQAGQRASYLKLAVTAQFEKVKGNITAGALVHIDLGGTASMERISNFRFDIRSPEVRPTGPGALALETNPSPTNPSGLWTAKKMARLLVTVVTNRSAN